MAKNKTPRNGLITLKLSKQMLNYNSGGGLEIRIQGFKSNPACPEEGQIFIEYYEKKIRVHVWNGEQDPVTTEIEKE